MFVIQPRDAARATGVECSLAKLDEMANGADHARETTSHTELGTVPKYPEWEALLERPLVAVPPVVSDLGLSGEGTVEAEALSRDDHCLFGGLFDCLMEAFPVLEL